MTPSESITDTWRFERKFLLEDVSLAAAEAMITLHPAGFRTTFPSRQVNNIYYDTIGMNNYRANDAGTSSRQKFRVRWYGETSGKVKKPKLEIKRKEGQVGSKDSHKLASFQLDSEFDLKEIHIPARNTSLPQSIQLEWSCLNPVLVNSYHRKYFLSLDGTFRLTLDHDLCFYPVFGNRARLMSPYPMPRALVLEVKYSTEEDDRVHQLTSAFSFRMTKSSKYAMGIERVLRR